MKKNPKNRNKIVFFSCFLRFDVSVDHRCFFGVKGYQMYQDAVHKTPLHEKVETIRNTEGFTKYEELPEIYVEAVVSVEDKRFWSHHGVDYLAIGRALWNDIRAMSFVEGGSTISQQLMKNEYFTQEKKLERKFAEVFAAWELEREYGKKEIFELYVNTIYFGSGYYGIHDAAEGYFGKEPSQLPSMKRSCWPAFPMPPQPIHRIQIRSWPGSA